MTPTRHLYGARPRDLDIDPVLGQADFSIQRAAANDLTRLRDADMIPSDDGDRHIALEIVRCMAGARVLAEALYHD